MLPSRLAQRNPLGKREGCCGTGGDVLGNHVIVRARTAGRLVAALLATTSLTQGVAWAVDVTTETELRNAIFAANGGGASNINVTANITLKIGRAHV